MTQKWVSYFLFIGSAILVSLAFNLRAFAADCGGAVACACGNNVTASRTLSAAVDPVLFDPVAQPGDAACSGDGLIMNTDGVILNLGGGVIKGDSGAGDVGIRILDGVDNLGIRNGRVNTFGTGIKTDGTTTGSSIKGVRTRKHTVDGIDIAGNSNTLLNNRANLNDGNGIKVTGNNNVVDKNRAQGNGLTGIEVVGDNNDLNINTANNNEDGILVTGSDNSLEKNRAQSNNDDGILVTDTGGGNTDDGQNIGKNNGDVQCEIDGVDCI